jgi:hypothetical protein
MLMLMLFNFLVQLMLDREPVISIPTKQKMARQETLRREHVEEHKAALRRAVTLSVPDAECPSVYGTFNESLNDGSRHEQSDSNLHSSSSESSISRQRISWAELIDRIFEKDESGQMVVRKSLTESKS